MSLGPGPTLGVKSQSASIVQGLEDDFPDCAEHLRLCLGSVATGSTTLGKPFEPSECQFPRVQAGRDIIYPCLW